MNELDRLKQQLKAFAEEYLLLKKKISQPQEVEMTTLASGKKSFKQETSTQKEGEKTIQVGKEKAEANKPATDAEKDKKIAGALALLKEYGPKDVELANKEYEAKLEALKKTSKTTDKGKYETEAKAVLEAKAKAEVKLKNLAEGLQILVEAGVLAEATYKANAEYKGKYASMTASFEAAARFEAKARGTINLLNLEAGKLVEIDLKAEVKAEAVVKGQVKVTGTTIPVALQVDAEAYARANATAEMQVIVTKDNVTGNINLDAGASVGASAKGSAALTHKGKNLLTFSGEASVEAGARATFQAKFELKNGKLHIVFKEGLVVGVGGSVAGDIQIDFAGIANAIADKVREQGFIDKINAWYADLKKEAKETIKEAKAKLAAAEKEVDKLQAKIEESLKQAKKDLSAKAQKFVDETEARIADAKVQLAKYEKKISKVVDDAGKLASKTVKEGVEKLIKTTDDIGNWASKKWDKLNLNPFK